MKIVYWYMYFCSFTGQNHHASGALLVSDTTITSFVVGVGNVTWNIKDSEVREEHGDVKYARFTLEKDSVHSILYINNTYIVQLIQNYDKIIMIRKYPQLDRKYAVELLEKAKRTN